MMEKGETQPEHYPVNEEVLSDVLSDIIEWEEEPYSLRSAPINLFNEIGQGVGRNDLRRWSDFSEKEQELVSEWIREDLKETLGFDALNPDPELSMADWKREWRYERKEKKPFKFKDKRRDKEVEIPLPSSEETTMEVIEVNVYNCPNKPGYRIGIRELPEDDFELYLGITAEEIGELEERLYFLQKMFILGEKEAKPDFDSADVEDEVAEETINELFVGELTDKIKEEIKETLGVDFNIKPQFRLKGEFNFDVWPVPNSNPPLYLLRRDMGGETEILPFEETFIEIFSEAHGLEREEISSTS